jgi:DNA-binding LacI/PurR family transcriptional regulator
MLSPRLTSIRQSSDDIGRMAARKLIDLIERPEGASRKPSVFPVQLIEGGTIEAI